MLSLNQLGIGKVFYLKENALRLYIAVGVAGRSYNCRMCDEHGKILHDGVVLIHGEKIVVEVM